jgi:hypothetical protein
MWQPSNTAISTVKYEMIPAERLPTTNTAGNNAFHSLSSPPVLCFPIACCTPLAFLALTGCSAHIMIFAILMDTSRILLGRFSGSCSGRFSGSCSGRFSGRFSGSFSGRFSGSFFARFPILLLLLLLLGLTSWKITKKLIQPEDQMNKNKKTYGKNFLMHFYYFWLEFLELHS